jgi:hypothetical protein
MSFRQVSLRKKEGAQSMVTAVGENCPGRRQVLAAAVNLERKWRGALVQGINVGVFLEQKDPCFIR